VTPEPLRVVLCDDVAELRTLMRFALEEDGDLVIVGEAGDAITGVERIADLQPDVVLLDLSMPGMDGLEAIPLVRARSPGTAIVVFSGFAEERMRGPALEHGADRYVEKGADLTEVRAIVREAGTGRTGR
jgi:DNA-binding NarL/FixJ family response regulator